MVFNAESAIERIGIDGGTAVTLCQVSVAPSSMAWTGDSILYSDGGNAILCLRRMAVSQK